MTAASLSRWLWLLVLFCLPLGTVWLWGDPTPAGGRSPIALPKIYGVELLVLFASALTMGARWGKRADGQAVALPIAVVLVAALSVGWSADRPLAVTGVVHLTAALGTLAFLPALLRESDFRQKAFRIFAVAVGIQAVWAIAQFGVQHDLGLTLLGESSLSPSIPGVANVVAEGQKVIRAYGSLPHPNILAAFLAAGLFLGLSALLQQAASARQRWLAASFVALTSSALVLTFSRIALVVVALNTVLLLLFHWRRWHRLPKEAAVAVLGIVATVLIVWPVLSTRTALNAPQEPGISNRAVGASAALELIATQPYGVGQGNFIPAIEQIRPDLPAYQQQPVHNVPLLIATELGPLMAVVVMTYVVRLGWRFHRLRPPDGDPNTAHFAIMMLGGVFVALGMFDHFWWTSPPALLLLAGYAALVQSRQVH